MSATRDSLAQLLYSRFGTGHPRNDELWQWHADAILAHLGAGVITAPTDNS